MPPRKRPLEILLLAWVVIGVGGLGVLSWLLLRFITWQSRELLQNPAVQAAQEEINRGLQEMTVLPVAYAEHAIILISLVWLTAGIGLLQAGNWARVLFVIVVLVGLLFSFVYSGSLGFLLVRLPFSLAFLVILLTSRANAYFSNQSQSEKN